VERGHSRRHTRSICLQDMATSKQQSPTFLLRCAANLPDIPPEERLAARVGCGGMAANMCAAAAGVAAAVAAAATRTAAATMHTWQFCARCQDVSGCLASRRLHVKGNAGLCSTWYQLRCVDAAWRACTFQNQTKPEARLQRS
jgi:hypothetical protein